MAKKNDSLKAECRVLRLTLRMGNKAISERMNVPQGTVENWLRDIPLSNEERSALSAVNARKAGDALRRSCEARGLTEELRAECVRLHREEHWPISRIAHEKGLSKGTLKYWFKDLPPLSKEEISLILSNSRSRKPRISRKVAIMPKASMSEEQSHLHRRQHTARIGYASELAVMSKLANRMWISFMPGAECANKTDLIATPGFHCRSIVRIQVKTLKWPERGHPVINLRNSGTQVGFKRKTVRRYHATDFDILVGYLPETDTAYVLNWNDIGDRKAGVSIRPEHAEAWHKLDTFFSPADLDGQAAYWESLASDD